MSFMFHIAVWKLKRTFYVSGLNSPWKVPHIKLSLLTLGTKKLITELHIVAIYSSGQINRNVILIKCHNPIQDL